MEIMDEDEDEWWHSKLEEAEKYFADKKAVDLKFGDDCNLENETELGDIRNIVQNLVIDMGGGIEISPVFETMSESVNTMAVTKAYDRYMTSTLDYYRRTPIFLYLAIACNRDISEQRGWELFGVIGSETVRADWNKLTKNSKPNSLSNFKSILVKDFDGLRLDRITLKLISDLGGLLQPWPELETVLMTKISRGTDVERSFEVLRNFGNYRGQMKREIKQTISKLFYFVFSMLTKHVMAAKTIRKMLQLQPLQNKVVRRNYMFYLVQQYNDLKLCRSVHKNDKRSSDVRNDDELIENILSVRAELILIEKSDDNPDDNLVKTFRRMLPFFQRDVICEEHTELVKCKVIKEYDVGKSDRKGINNFKRIVDPLIRELQHDERMSFSTPLQQWSKLYSIDFSKDQLSLLLPKLMLQKGNDPDISGGYMICSLVLMATHVRHLGEWRGNIIRDLVETIGAEKMVSELNEMSTWIRSLGGKDENKSEDERFRKRPILLYLGLVYTLELDDENDSEEKMIQNLRTINLEWLTDEYRSLEEELSPIFMKLLIASFPFVLMGGLTCPKLRRNTVTMVASLINSGLFVWRCWEELTRLVIAKLDNSDAANRCLAVALLSDILFECAVKNAASDLIDLFFPLVLPLLWSQKSEDAARLLMFMLNYDSKQTDDRRVRQSYMKLLACMCCFYDVKGREAELRNMRKVLARLIAIDESQPDQDYKLLKKIRKELFGSTKNWDWMKTYGQGLTINIERLKFKVKEPMEMRPYPVRAIQRGPTNKPFLPS